MTVKESITEEMYKLSLLPKVVFLGENIINSGRIYDTLDKVSLSKCIEMPVAENLIAGAAIGLSLRGYMSVCIFQRMDFMFIAADAIINHACMYPKMTNGKVKCPVIFRTIKADLNKKFFVGHQHSKDLTHVFAPYMDVIQVPYTSARKAYQKARVSCNPTLIVEDYTQFNEPA